MPERLRVRSQSCYGHGMTTNGNIIAYFRIIAPRKGSARDAYGEVTIPDWSWDTLHGLRHELAEAADIDPMRVDIYNVKGRDGEYVGGFNAHDGCDTCKWDQSRY